MTIRDAIKRGDVIRTVFPSAAELPLYLGSGSSGGCFDGYGLMNDGMFRPVSPDGKEYDKHDELWYKHSDHWKKGNFGIDNWLPLYQICFAETPRQLPHKYRQELKLYEGLLETNMSFWNAGITVRDYFNPYKRDILAVEYSYSGTPRPLLLKPAVSANTGYEDSWKLKPLTDMCGFTCDTGNTSTRVSVRIISERGSCGTVPSENGLRIEFSEGEGKHLLLIAASDITRHKELLAEIKGIKSISGWRDECRESWARRYGKKYINDENEFIAKMWARSLYYVLCSFAPEKNNPSPPMGWSGFGWRFHFSQDISYIHPALLKLGHLDIAKSIVEFYRDRIPQMESATKRIYGGKGTMWAWEFPIGTKDELMLEGKAPNIYQFEIHNAAYPARMALETSQVINDPEWTKNIAIPVIKGSADFYASHLTREANGKWSLQVVPSMSQDEWSEPDGRNYLCALYSARYSFNAAKGVGLDGYDSFIKDGLAFDLLLDKKRNLYKTSEAMPEYAWGHEKHPVQLNPFVFLPAGHTDEAENNAYRLRREICVDAAQKYYAGWTLGAFWVSAAARKDRKALRNELLCADDPNFTDREKLQFYETSGQFNAPYYVTTHGFWLQALADEIVEE